MNKLHVICLAGLLCVLSWLPGCGGGSEGFPREMPFQDLNGASNQASIGVDWVWTPNPPCLSPQSACVRFGTIIRSQAEFDDYFINHDGPHTPAIQANIEKYRIRALYLPNMKVDFSTHEVIAMDQTAPGRGSLSLAVTEYEDRLEVDGTFVKFELVQDGVNSGDFGVFLVVPISPKSVVFGKFGA